MRLVVWGQSKETDLIMVLWVTAFLPYGGANRTDTGPLAGQGPRGSLCLLALQHPHHPEESDKVPLPPSASLRFHLSVCLSLTCNFAMYTKPSGESKQ